MEHSADNDSSSSMTTSINTDFSAGLLNGVDLDKDEVYATELGSVDSIVAPTAGDFWASATRDALDRGASTPEYLETMNERLMKFLDSSHVTDRDLVTDKLREYSKRKAVHILLGGKSTGKTKVLMNFCMKYGEDDDLGAMLVYVNGRADSLKQGLKNALDKIKVDDSFFKGFDLLDFVAGVGICASASIEGADLVTSGGIGGTIMTVGEYLGVAAGTSAALKKLIELVFTKAEYPTEGLMRLLLEVAEKQKRFPCLIIDEANLIIKGKNDETEKLMGMILRTTKEQRKMSCILCSSQHSYPDTLRQGGLQLDVAKIVYLPELGPQAMWSFLTKEVYPDTNDVVVGMGAHLAKHLMSVCGGRILHAASIVSDLRDQKQSFCVNDTLFSIEGANNVKKMLKPDKNSGYRKSLDENGLRNLAKLLNDMSKKGFCKIPSVLESSDSLVSILVDEGVGGKIQRSHFLHKDWEQLFGPLDNDEIVVPSSTSLRLVIAVQMKLLQIDAPESPCK